MSVATPPLSVAVPRLIVPVGVTSLNETVPVGVPVFGLVTTTVAVRSTVWSSARWRPPGSSWSGSP